MFYLWEGGNKRDSKLQDSHVIRTDNAMRFTCLPTEPCAAPCDAPHMRDDTQTRVYFRCRILWLSS